MRLAAPLSALVFGALAVAPAACKSSSSSEPGADAGDGADTRPPTPPEWDRAVTRPDDATAKDQRGACKFARGALPAETLGKGTPIDKDIPIKTIIVVMQENRSFDSYFGHLGKYAGRTDIESAPDTTTLPDKAGGAPSAANAYQHAPHPCFLDTNHEWAGSHVEYNGGKNDGFVEANQGYGETKLASPRPELFSGARSLFWYDERDLPFYYELAKTFGVADHYHCSLLGPTWPNRMYLYSATSFGKTSNVFPDLTSYPFPGNDATIFDELEKRHVDWNIYNANAPGAGVVVGTSILTRWGRNPLHTIAEFMDDAAAGRLPSVVFVDPYLGAEGVDRSDEHPPADIQVGQKFVSDIVHALFKSPQWKTSALFLTYDENGGVYDHVAPPTACAPDATPPKLESGDTTAGGFDRLGFRVPLVVVSPYAKKGYVSHVQLDHTSITRFIQAKFKLPALSARDANAEPLFDLFDFSAAQFPDPPPIAEPTVDQAQLDYCKATFAK